MIIKTINCLRHTPRKQQISVYSVQDFIHIHTHIQGYLVGHFEYFVRKKDGRRQFSFLFYRVPQKYAKCMNR